MGASTYVRELVATIVVIKKWRHYLLGHHFFILIDHRSLRELMTQAIQTPEQHRYLVRLLGFDYTIQYRAGRNNVVADALSHVNEEEPAEFFLISMPQFAFLDDL